MSTVAVNKIEDLSANQNKGVLQVVSTTKTDTFTTGSSTLVDITGFSLAITPRSTDSKILLLVSCMLSAGTYGGYMSMVQLVRDSTPIALGTSTATNQVTMGIVHEQVWEVTTSATEFLDSPNTTSAITYKVQAKDDNGEFFLNRKGYDTAICGVSSLTAMEIQG
jgi:hypothetical protein